MAEQAPARISVPATRAYRTTVARTQRLSAHFLRVTVTAPELAHFGPQGTAAEPGEAAGSPAASPAAWDQRIKLFLPREDGTYPEIGLFSDPPATTSQWYGAWRQLDTAQRNPIRTYTVRSIRTAAREVDIDFVVHQEHAGPAVSWALGAAEGDELIIIGPDRRADQPDGGIDFTPGTAQELLLVGDETAVPAISAILEALPQHYTGEAYLEVPSAEDVLEVSTASGVQIHWLARSAEQQQGELLASAVEGWIARRTSCQMQSPAAPEEAGSLLPTVDDDPVLDDDAVLWETSEPEGYAEYAWLAGEAGVITRLRRRLVKDHGLSRKQVSFMGYWKQGRPSA